MVNEVVGGMWKVGKVELRRDALDALMDDRQDFSKLLTHVLGQRESRDPSRHSSSLYTDTTDYIHHDRPHSSIKTRYQLGSSQRCNSVVIRHSPKSVSVLRGFLGILAVAAVAVAATTSTIPVLLHQGLVWDSSYRAGISWKCSNSPLLRQSQYVLGRRVTLLFDTLHRGLSCVISTRRTETFQSYGDYHPSELIDDETYHETCDPCLTFFASGRATSPRDYRILITELPQSMTIVLIGCMRRT